MHYTKISFTIFDYSGPTQTQTAKEKAKELAKQKAKAKYKSNK